MTEGATLSSLLESIGTEFLRVFAAPSGLEVRVAGPVIDDPADPSPIDAGDLLLAVGTLAESPVARTLLARAGASAASGVVFRTQGPPPESLVREAELSKVALLGVIPAMAWSQLHTLLRSACAAAGLGASDAEPGGASGDLFALANAIAARVGGPTTIEDPQSTVLAFSSLNEPIDEARRDTILGRRVPEDWLRRLHEDGVFRRLWSEDQVIRVDYPEVRRRLAIAIKAGGELLGSIWVAEDKRPFDAAAEAALAEAAEIAALHLIRARSSEDLERGRRSALLRSLIDGNAVGPVLAELLGVKPDCFAAVIVFRLPAGSQTELAVQARRACRFVDLYCESTRRRAASVAAGRDVYLLLADGARPAVERLEAVAQEILGDRGDIFPQGTVAGVGSVVEGLAEATLSRDEARRVAGVLEAASGGSRVASIERVRSHAIVERIAEIAAGEPGLLKGPLDTLFERDREGRGHYVETLRAFLDHFGDSTAAAASLDVHPNTFRYRMRRLLEISGLDLDDPVERMVVHLQLRIRDSQP
jgi:hypothetical protein